MFLGELAFDAREIAIISLTDVAITLLAGATCGAQIADVSEWVIYFFNPHV